MKTTLTLTSSMAALALGAGAAFPATAQTVEQFCSTSTPKDINYLQTTTDAIVVPSGIGTIDDLNVYVDISHSFVGDLVIGLEHSPPGTTTTLLDRPGSPPGPGCDEEDIEATFDDQAASAAENMCNLPPVPAISGSVIGGHPPNPSLLASYDGQDIGGTWTLAVDDLQDGDTGALNGWCLIAEVSSFNQAATCDGFAPPFDAPIGLNKKEQRVIPLRMALLDEDGFPLGPDDITAPTVSVSYASGSGGGELEQLVDSPGKASSGNSFVWDEGSQRWAFNLSTKPYTAAGTYTATAVAGDVEYVLNPTCTGTFVRQ